MTYKKTAPVRDVCKGAVKVLDLFVWTFSVQPLRDGVVGRQLLIVTIVGTTIGTALLHRASFCFRTHAIIDTTPTIKNVNTFIIHS